MKKINFSLVALAAIAVCACNPKEEVKLPAPVVTMVTSAEDVETAIDTVALNQSIAIHGENFVDVTSINLNTVDVDIREAYITETRIDIVVPRVIPQNPNNKLVITTKGGSVEYNLVVELPVLKVYGFKNDFADDGAIAEVVGENFDLYQIDKEHATLTLNGAPVQMIDCNGTSFTFEVPAGTPWPSGFGDDCAWGASGKWAPEERNFLKEYGNATSTLEISSPGLTAPVKVPFREMGVSIMTNDRDTWWNGWWPTGIINCNDFANDPNLKDITPFFQWAAHIKMTTSNAWQYENVVYIHWWMPEAGRDVEAHPEDYVVKMEILNPSTTPLAKYLRVGNALVESKDNDHFLMWDPAQSNGGVALNTMGKWQTISFEVKDLFYPLEEGKNTSIVLSTQPATSFDDETTFKIAAQREEPGDIEFYFWNIRIVKKIKL